MKYVRGIGTFMRVKEHIFRTDAELHFGSGSCKKVLLTMLNPGASRLSNDREWNEVLLNEVMPTTGAIELDQTMKWICDIIEKALPDYDGVIRICNLFNLRCGNLNEALKLYAQLKNDMHFKDGLETDFLTIPTETYSCSWLGWSLKEHGLLNRRKQQVFQLLRTEHTGVPSIAKHRDDNAENFHVWHVRPQIKAQAEEYRQFIVPILQEVLSREES